MNVFSNKEIGFVLVDFREAQTPYTYKIEDDVTYLEDEEGIASFHIFTKDALSDIGCVALTSKEEMFISQKVATQISYEELQTQAKNIPFVVGYVQSCEPHPDSDHLHVCQVDIGTEKLQIVCGAANVREGLYVAVAKIGALMPSGKRIVPSVLRKVASEGMLCSARELYFTSMAKKGILELPKVPLGTDVRTLKKQIEGGR